MVPALGSIAFKKQCLSVNRYYVLEAAIRRNIELLALWNINDTWGVQALKVIHSHDIFYKPEMSLFNKTSPELFIRSFSVQDVMGWIASSISFSF